MPSVVVPRLPGPQAHEVVDQRIAGAGVEGDELDVAVDEGDVGDAAEIEHADRMRTLELADQGPMEHRHDRGALPAGGDIGGAEVIDHGDPEPGGERRPVADLDREAAVGPVQDGLAVETHHSDRARRHPVGGQERFHRLGMHVGDELFDLGENFRPLGTVAEIGRDRDRAPQQVALLVAVGPVPGGAERTDLLAVGLDQRDIDPVIGGAAHQTNGSDARHGACPRLNPTPDLLHHRPQRGDTNRR